MIKAKRSIVLKSLGDEVLERYEVEENGAPEDLSRVTVGLGLYSLFF